MTKHEYVRDYLSKYNEIRLSPQELERIIKSAQLALIDLLKSNLNEFKFESDDGLVTKYPEGEFFINRFNDFYDELILEIKGGKQTISDKIRYGDHDRLFDSVFNRIGRILDVIR